MGGSMRKGWLGAGSPGLAAGWDGGADVRIEARAGTRRLEARRGETRRFEAWYARARRGGPRRKEVPCGETGRGCASRVEARQDFPGRTEVGRQRGLSALELLLALGVAAVLAGLAVPGFAALRRSTDVSSAANELVWALHLARSSAVLRGQPVTVCLSPDESSCLQTPAAPASGWVVFQAAGQAVAVQSAPTGSVLHRFRLPEKVAVQGTRPAVTFWPVSRAGSTSTFEICDVTRRTPGRSIVVSQTGRPRVAAEAPSCVW